MGPVVLHHIIRHDDGKCLALLARQSMRFSKNGAKDVQYMGVSENSGFSPQIIHSNRVFHYEPSILGYHYFWKHPYVMCMKNKFQQTCITNDKLLETNSSPLKIGRADISIPKIHVQLRTC